MTFLLQKATGVSSRNKQMQNKCKFCEFGQPRFPKLIKSFKNKPLEDKEKNVPLKK